MSYIVYFFIANEAWINKTKNCERLEDWALSWADRLTICWESSFFFSYFFLFFKWNFQLLFYIFFGWLSSSYKIENCFRCRLLSFSCQGAHLTLKDDRWALAVESCIKKFGWAFCCHDNHDQQVLKQLFMQVCSKDSIPTIIVSRFQVCLF